MHERKNSTESATVDGPNEQQKFCRVLVLRLVVHAPPLFIYHCGGRPWAKGMNFLLWELQVVLSFCRRPTYSIPSSCNTITWPPTVMVLSRLICNGIGVLRNHGFVA